MIFKFKKYFLLVVVALGVTFCGRSAEQSIQVMTYNIRYYSESGEHSWSDRKEGVINLIRKYEPDIIGLQEAWENQITELINNLNDYFYVGVGRDDGTSNGEHTAILIKSTRLKCLSDSTFWLSETPGVPSKGWDGAFSRITTLAKLADLNTDKILYVFNTHFDHIGTDARNKSAELLVNQIPNIAGSVPSILIGDFNSEDTSQVYKKLTSKFIDAKNISKQTTTGPDLTFNGFDNEIQSGRIIDHIFVSSKIDVISHSILNEKINGKYPSDHMPVLTELKIN